mmetsp:Transcript_50568/g.118091  ORF Transcript_50568/g.118091 Transcript_50568/m.118091 type:complete len:82 (+) Transcript_50568:3082-3327(+)
MTVPAELVDCITVMQPRFEADAESNGEAVANAGAVKALFGTAVAWARCTNALAAVGVVRRRSAATAASMASPPAAAAQACS